MSDSESSSGEHSDEEVVKQEENKGSKKKVQIRESQNKEHVESPKGSSSDLSSSPKSKKVKEEITIEVSSPGKEKKDKKEEGSKGKDWEEHTNDYGEKYWYNPDTNESTWDNPYGEELPEEYVSSVSFYSKKNDKIKRSEVHEAAFRGDLVQLQKLLKKSVFKSEEQHLRKINRPDQAGATALHYATFAAYPDCVRALIEAKANPRIKDGFGLTPLHLAAAKGFLDGIKQLLDAGADINALDEDGCTPIFYAVVRNQEEAVNLLIEKGADVDIRNKDGESPLHSATLFENINMVKVLVEKGAQANTEDSEGKSPLHEAAISGNLEIMKFLLKAKDVRLNEKNVQIQVGIDKKDKSGATALHYATFYGRSQCAELLVTNSADVNLTDDDGSTCLHNAAFNKLTRIMKFLIKHGAVVNAVDSQDQTPLRTCALNGNSLGMKVLLAEGAKVDPIDKSGMSPLHVAACGGHTLCIQMLLKAGADYTILDKRGISPLAYAAYSGSLGAIMLLLNESTKAKHSPDSASGINHSDNSGMTPLLTAVKWNRVEAAEYLISQKASLRVINKKQQNAMHLALEHLATSNTPETRNSSFNMIALLEEEDDGSMDLKKMLKESSNEGAVGTSNRALSRGLTSKKITALRREENQQRRYDFSDLQVFWTSDDKPKNKTLARPKQLNRVQTQQGKFASTARRPSSIKKATSKGSLVPE